MNAKQLMRYCREARYDLEELEDLLPYLKDNLGAAEFISACISDINELEFIAKYETPRQATSRQTKHINKIMLRITNLIGQASDNPAGGPDYGED